MDVTRKFTLADEQKVEMRAVLIEVSKALEEKGYNSIDQIVGYLLSEDPTYVTNHRNARVLIRRIDRDDLLHELVRSYIGK